MIDDLKFQIHVHIQYTYRTHTDIYNHMHIFWREEQPFENTPTILSILPPSAASSGEPVAPCTLENHRPWAKLGVDNYLGYIPWLSMAHLRC